MYLTYFKREFAKKHGNSGVLARFVLFLSGIGRKIIKKQRVTINKRLNVDMRDDKIITLGVRSDNSSIL